MKLKLELQNTYELNVSPQSSMHKMYVYRIRYSTTSSNAIYNILGLNSPHMSPDSESFKILRFRRGDL